MGLEGVVEMMRLPGVYTTVKWETCGELNAFYYSPDREVTLCKELLTEPPGVIRAILAHELAHGVIHQRNIPFTGSSEEAADELSAVMLLLHGYHYDVESVAKWWAAKGIGDHPHDPHLSSERRAVALQCFHDQYEHKVTWPWSCPVNWDRASDAWLRLLGYR